MKSRLIFAAVTMFLVTSIPLFARGPTGASADEAFWVDYWAKPRVALGPEEQAFNQNMHEIVFAHDRFDHALDEDALNADVQWLKDHPGAHFFIEGYASMTGSEAYNLHLSGQRAEWIRQVLIRKGRIGWRCHGGCCIPLVPKTPKGAMRRTGSSGLLTIPIERNTRSTQST
jgi:hypothetical protein